VSSVSRQVADASDGQRVAVDVVDDKMWGMQAQCLERFGQKGIWRRLSGN
jgi:hypothetical protein